MPTERGLGAEQKKMLKARQCVVLDKGTMHELNFLVLLYFPNFTYSVHIILILKVFHNITQGTYH